MYTTRHFLISLLASTMSWLPSLAFGQQAPTACTPKDTAIYFGNGVWTTRTQAKRNLESLQNALRSSFSIPAEEFQNIEFLLAYNTTNNHVNDLLEAAIQDLSTDFTQFFRILAHLVPMPESFKEELIGLADAIDEAALLTNQDLATHVSSYKGKVLEGKKVVLVAHSQGNLFANQAYGNLTSTERASFGVVSVANPDSFVAGSGPYTTLIEDLVILSITLAKQRAGLPTPLPPNTTNLLTSNDLSGHGFVSAYLARGGNSRASVLGDVVSSRAGLVAPPSSGGQGIITVTLTWGGQPDVDLHAFEPNGTHVYYANRTGPSGYLDVDDVTGYGPEHYYVGCNTVETGSYRIGVNYYSGSAPEVANVLVQAGLAARGFSVYLPTALGSSGNASPVPVGTIAVSGDNQSGYSFVIQ